MEKSDVTEFFLKYFEKNRMKCGFLRKQELTLPSYPKATKRV